MKTALAVVLSSLALLLLYLYIGGLLLGYLRIRFLPGVNIGDVAAVVLILLYGYAVYSLGKIAAKSRCEHEGRRGVGVNTGGRRRGDIQ
ncbi:MAG: hypothetical protein ABWJ97_05905 [Thermoproteus sp.]